MKHENVMDELKSIMDSIPADASPLEKLRYVYVKAGDVFSYDYYYSENENFQKIRIEDGYVDRYLTCKETTIVLAEMINNIDKENIKCEVIKRAKTYLRGEDEIKHVSNLVTFSTGEKFILDLALDLHLIQSGCQTMEFGYTTMDGDEDIISLKECEVMDKKLGLIKNGEYTDKKIKAACDELENVDFSEMSFEEEVITKMNYINSLFVKFRGLHEGKNYCKMLLSRIGKFRFKEFNLRDSNNNMLTCYLISNLMENEAWYIYDMNNGLVKTTPHVIFDMLQNGWNSKSLSLDGVLENSITR